MGREIELNGYYQWKADRNERERWQDYKVSQCEILIPVYQPLDIKQLHQ